MIKTCPLCRKTYDTILERHHNSDKPIQEQHPNATPEEREQLISGICSNKCWKLMFGERP